MSNEDVRAVPALVIDGEKQDVSVLFIRVNCVDMFEKEKLLKAIAKTIYLHKAVLSESAEGTFLALFNVPMKQYKHELEAVKAAFDIQEETKNLKSLKIGFGINNGEIVASGIMNGAINYTPLGNTINFARRLSTRSENNILFTRNVYERIRENVKAEELRDLKEDIGAQVYSLLKVVERGKYNDYVRDFLHRMQKEGIKF